MNASAPQRPMTGRSDGRAGAEERLEAHFALDTRADEIAALVREFMGPQK